MNGYIVISLENGLMLFTHTNNNYGLSEPKEPLEISSYLYAVYTLSKSWYDDHDDIQRDEILNESIITSFRESPLSYFQQDGIFWHFYEICGKDSDILTIVSSSYQIDHQYALLFAAKLSQTFLTVTISDCVSPRSKIGKQLRENYKNLLEVRVKEIIYYLFENLFIGSSSIGLVYVPEECSSMIHSYQLLERGKYILDSTAFSLLDTLSEQWNSPNPPPPPQVEINTTESNHLPPQRYLSSRSEANLAANTSISTDERPHTAGEALNLQEEEDSGSFLKSPLEWMRKKFTFKSKKSKLQSSTEDPGKLNSQDDKLMVDPGTGLGSDKSHQRNTSWQLFHLDDQLAALRRDEGCPCSIPETSIPWLFQLIQTYQEHHLHLSNQDRIASMTTSLPPFILSTSIPSPQTEVDPSLDQYIHLLDLSNSLYTSLSSRNLNVFLIWNESGYVYSPPPQPPSSLENPTESLSSTKDKIIEIFQTIPELKLLFLEFLEINLHLHLYQN